MTTNRPFEIYLAWSERVLGVGVDQSALDVLQAADSPIEPGCMTGGCGECRTAYVEGDVVQLERRAAAPPVNTSR